MPTRADVIVIGGGQAGLATSRELGLAGSSTSSWSVTGSARRGRACGTTSG